MGQTNIVKNFDDVVVRWWTHLCTIVSDIRSRGAQPRLIALSRKMPRFITWFSERFQLSPEVASACPKSILDEVELTTELAIPFYYLQLPATSPVEYILLDDFIIHGTTLRTVADNLEIITGKKCHLSCLAKLKTATSSPYIIDDEFEQITELYDFEIDGYVDAVCNRIRATQLPIDMEFPVFNLLRDWRQLTRVRQTVDEHPAIYERIKNTQQFRILIPVYQSASPNTDFFKIRAFIKSDSQFAIEVFAPIVVADSHLTTTEYSLFDDFRWQNLWDSTTLAIRSFINDNITHQREVARWDRVKFSFKRTLCVWANYLHSLASYINIAAEYEIDQPSELNLHDLALLITGDVAERIAPGLLTLTGSADHYMSMTLHLIDVKSEFAPEPFASAYESLKIEACITSETIEQLLTGIFSFQHYKNPAFSNPYLQYDRLMFGETYESIRSAMRPFFVSDDDCRRMQLWIDDNIDAGYVVPKYELVTNDKELPCWRRFFHAGIRTRQQPQPN